MESQFSELDSLKEKLDNLRPLHVEEMGKLKDDLLFNWTHHSTAIEGNTLTLSETKAVLEDGITIGGKTVREHSEIINHKDAILYLEEIIKNKEDLSEWEIKQIHNLVLKEINQKNAGRYRTQNVIITGAIHHPPNFLHVQEKMDQFLKWYREESPNLHPIERATCIHNVFVEIHPFIDGNGRVARLLLNFELLKSGFPIAIIKKEDRDLYYDSISKALFEGAYEPIVQLIYARIKDTFDLYWYVLSHRIQKGLENQ